MKWRDARGKKKKKKKKICVGWENLVMKGGFKTESI